MNCLLCYKPLPHGEIDYHPNCIKRVFNVKQMPRLDIDEKQLAGYARQIVGVNRTITGVQPKLSLWLEENKEKIRFTIVDNKSNYIIKPQSENYPFLPENEDLCMHLAHVFGIETAIHGLVRLSSGSLAYITRRFDRAGESKLACEDLCQLTEALTHHKYKGSYERAGKILKYYSTQAGFDALRYFELLVFSFIIGNADMHLKNFSLLEKEAGRFSLSPAYDLVSTILVIKNDPDQLGLTLNGKKNKITRKDMDALGKNLLLTKKQIENCYHAFLKKRNSAMVWIDSSFLSDSQKIILKEVVEERLNLFTIDA